MMLSNFDVKNAREEALIQRKLKHPNIVEIYGFYEKAQMNWTEFDIIMEYSMGNSKYIYIYI